MGLMYASVQFRLAGKPRIISSPFKGHLTEKVHSMAQQLGKVDQGGLGVSAR